MMKFTSTFPSNLMPHHTHPPIKLLTSITSSSPTQTPLQENLILFLIKGPQLPPLEGPHDSARPSSPSDLEPHTAPSSSSSMHIPCLAIILTHHHLTSPPSCPFITIHHHVLTTSTSSTPNHNPRSHHYPPSKVVLFLFLFYFCFVLFILCLIIY